MAIRRPSVFSSEWLVQDFSLSIDGSTEWRYTQIKWDGLAFSHENETFDYSNPPYTNSEQRGGPIVAQIDYSIVGNVITIEDWSTIWRDELPLRVGINNLVNCRYPNYKNWVVRVAKDTEAYAFFVSEYFYPYTNVVSPDSYLYFTVESVYTHA